MNPTFYMQLLLGVILAQHDPGQCREWGYPSENTWNHDEDCCACIACGEGGHPNGARCESEEFQLKILPNNICAEGDWGRAHRYECTHGNMSVGEHNPSQCREWGYPRGETWNFDDDCCAQESMCENSGQYRHEVWHDQVCAEGDWGQAWHYGCIKKGGEEEAIIIIVIVVPVVVFLLCVCGIGFCFWRKSQSSSSNSAAMAIVMAQSQRKQEKKDPPKQEPKAATPSYNQQPQMAPQPQLAQVQPVMQQPVMQQPMMQQPVMQQPVMQQPVMQQPVMQQPVMQQPMMMQQPVMQQPVMQQPMMMQQPGMMQQPQSQNTNTNASNIKINLG